jgi:3-hydroxybutyryl-CoA dehydrogenase
MSIHSIGVVGAGVMGGGIAQVAATAGLPVTLVDVSDAVLKKGVDRISANLERQAAKGAMTAEAKETALRLVKATTVYDRLGDADLVVEAATENLDLKSEIVERIGAAVRADAVIATNTSSLSITRLASLVTNPGRFVGMHFFNPVTRDAAGGDRAWVAHRRCHRRECHGTREAAWEDADHGQEHAGLRGEPDSAADDQRGLLRPGGR